jgi:hypothetical protein
MTLRLILPHQFHNHLAERPQVVHEAWEALGPFSTGGNVMSTGVRDQLRAEFQQRPAPLNLRPIWGR